MKYIYHIDGMTCNGCRTSVENSLANIGEVHQAQVSLADKTVIVEAYEYIDIAILRNKISDKYTLTERAGDFQDEGRVLEERAPSKLKQLRPLFLILSYIVVASFFLNRNEGGLHNGMLDFMGLFFIVFSFFKLLDVKGFAQSFTMYDPLAKRFPAYGKVYPFIEVGLGLMVLLRWNIQIAMFATIVILGITTIGVAKTLLDKKDIQCACLGTALSLPMTEATFIENAIMILMAGVILITQLL